MWEGGNTTVFDLRVALRDMSSGRTGVSGGRDFFIFNKLSSRLEAGVLGGVLASGGRAFFNELRSEAGGRGVLEVVASGGRAFFKVLSLEAGGRGVLGVVVASGGRAVFFSKGLSVFGATAHNFFTLLGFKAFVKAENFSAIVCGMLKREGVGATQSSDDTPSEDRYTSGSWNACCSAALLESALLKTKSPNKPIFQKERQKRQSA